MKMFVGNSTQQRCEFSYRIPEIEKRRTITIEALSQVLLPDQDLTQPQVDAIIKQHERFGFVSADEISRSRSPGFYRGLCYSVDKPIQSGKIETLLRSNQEVLENQGKGLRRNAAIAAQDRLTSTMADGVERGQAPRDLAMPQNFEVTTQHDVRTGDEMGDAKPVSEGWKSGSGGGRRR